MSTGASLRKRRGRIGATEAVSEGGVRMAAELLEATDVLSLRVVFVLVVPSLLLLLSRRFLADGYELDLTGASGRKARLCLEAAIWAVERW